MKERLSYQSGFGNQHATQAVEDALPIGQNSPQKVPFGLYAEQLSGSAFTAPRKDSIRSWLYRIRPSVLQGDFQISKMKNNLFSVTGAPITPPSQMRWDPLPYPKKPTNFLESWLTIACNGSIASHIGGSVHLYAFNQSMEKTYFYNADGELLIVPQEGSFQLKTELGLLDIQPQEIVVIPRGIKFQIQLLSDQARGYICENYDTPFKLPELGPIGANGLANPRDFLYPVAYYEEQTGDYLIVTKFLGQFWQASLDHSPLDVVAWHGNYAPYKYNLINFNVINSVSFDHPDPSIFTVLTSQSARPGVANIDFVIFPQRWMVAEHTFRPPYFHRNIMNEFMGLIYGEYDAKKKDFVPGGCSLHNCMSAHGPDLETYTKATTSSLQPEKYTNTLAFMFESSYVWQVTEFAQKAPFRQRNYLDCWKGLKANFSYQQ